MTRQQLAFEMGVSPERLRHIQQASSLEEAKNRLMALKVEAKAAYKRLAFRFHPDRNPGNVEAEANFKLSSEVLQEIEDLQVSLPPPIPNFEIVTVHFKRGPSATGVYGAAYDSTTTSTTRVYDAREVAYIRV